MINNTKSRASKKEVKQHLQNSSERNIVGGSGGLGFVGGAGVKAAKGAIQIVKNLLTRGSKPKNIGGFREFANPKLRDHFNKVPKSKPVEFMGPNPANKIGAGKNSYPR